jgi:hypothetical protein
LGEGITDNKQRKNVRVTIYYAGPRNGVKREREGERKEVEEDMRLRTWNVRSL